MYTAARASCSTAPHDPQRPIAAVISSPKTSSISPPIALPSSLRSSATRRSESLRADPAGLVAEPQQSVRGGVDEPRRPADEDVRVVLRRPGDLAKDLVVDAARIPAPTFRLGSRQGVGDLDPVPGPPLELLAVDDVVPGAGR